MSAAATSRTWERPAFAADLEKPWELDPLSLMLSAICVDGSEPVRGILDSVDYDLSTLAASLQAPDPDLFAVVNTVCLIQRRVRVANELAQRLATTERPMLGAKRRTA